MTLTARPWLHQIRPYRPGRSAAEPDGAMASNESPLGLSPAVAPAIEAALRTAHRYPSPLAEPLRERLAKLHGIGRDQVLVGNGSDELIYLLSLAYLAGGGHAVCADPPYRIDEISAYAVNGRLTRIPLRDWAHDLEGMASVEADIAYVVNPHNPTGTTRSLSDIAEFVRRSPAALVVVDEAYIDFVADPGRQSAVALLSDPRVAVLRTFSKIHGLAGLRVGYLMADPAVIDTLCKIRAPFSVGSLAQAAALATIADTEHAARVRAHTLAGRERLTALLTRAGLECVPSEANFVLCRTATEGPRSEQALVEHLGRHGISVRPGTGLGLPGTVRVSVPTEAGLALLAGALATLAHEPPSATVPLALDPTP